MERRFHYATVPLGAAGDVSNAKPRSIEWDLQTLTFIISMVMQAVTLVLSAVTLSQSGEPNPAPPLLIMVVAMELIVQCVEIVWYGLVGSLYYFGTLSIGVRYRYYDWVITTPTMLVSLLIFIWYLECPSRTNDDTFADGSKIAAIVCVVLADWVMLFFGYVYEAEQQWITKKLDFMGEGSGLWLGFLPFLAAFLPIFIAIGTSSTGWGWFTVIVTFITWLLYGVVALYFRTPDQAKIKNTSYNLLDIVSKNATACPATHAHTDCPCLSFIAGEQERDGPCDELHRAEPDYGDIGYTLERYRMQHHGKLGPVTLL